MSDKTLYLSDLDGTLLQNDASLSPFAVRELNRMIEKRAVLFYLQRPQHRYGDRDS